MIREDQRINMRSIVHHMHGLSRKNGEASPPKRKNLYHMLVQRKKMTICIANRILASHGVIDSRTKMKWRSWGCGMDSYAEQSIEDGQ